MIAHDSRSYPVLGAIQYFEIEDDRLKSLIYHYAFWTGKTLQDSDNQELMDKRVECIMDITERMMDLGYKPQDPKTVMDKVSENMIRCLPEDHSTDETEIAEFNSEEARERRRIQEDDSDTGE